MNFEDYLEADDETLESLPPEILEKLLKYHEDRASDFNIEQHALKILINALYGALANEFFGLANPDMAAAITSSGRFFIRLLANNIEDELQKLLPSPEPYICYGDTDSCYYQIKPFVEKRFGKQIAEQTDMDSLMEVVDWADAFEKKIIQKIIADTVEEYSEILNVWDPTKIGVEREIIADSAAFIAKKKYFARVWDSEGVRFSKDSPYIKVMGLEIARSSTPPWVKTKLKEAIPRILDTSESELRSWRDEIKKEFLEQPIMDISMTAGISSMDYDFSEKGVPQGPKSAHAHNLYVERLGLEGEIEKLKAGEKYKRCYLKTPNVFNSEVISFQDEKIANIIKEEGIFDHSKNFEKYFESPLEGMTEALGWNLTSKPLLDLW